MQGLPTLVRATLHSFLTRFDALFTSSEVRFKQYGVKSIEVVDNGSGIAEKDHESIGTFAQLARFPNVLIIPEKPSSITPRSYPLFQTCRQL